MPLIHSRVIEKHIEHIEPISENCTEILQAWSANLIEGIYNSETQNDHVFIQRILVDVLGYVQSGDSSNWTVAKNQPVGRGNVDVALGAFSANEIQILAPFELKGAKTRDLDAVMAGRNKTAVQQAWEYAMDAKGAKWVLVSNYREIRLYAVGYGRKDYEAFDLTKLFEPKRYARFILLLSADNLLSGKTASLLKESEQIDKEITDHLYADYKALRYNLIQTITKDNPTQTPLEVIRSTQTLLDRILFVAFAEDKGLLPDNTLKLAYEDRGTFNPRPVWDNFKGLFHAINKGNADLNIPAYNGGLFAPNPELDQLTISDELCEGFKKIGDYAFDSDVSVNILGHIFEQSISDVEELKANAEDLGKIDKKQSKRKKDGIFYTPSYITRYIVEKAVGGWLNDRKKELKFDSLPILTDEDYASIKLIVRGKRKGQIIVNKKIEKHITAWEEYKKILSNIKVIDPACGSGAFLNEVFDYLKAEGEGVNNQLSDLNGGQTTVFKWDTHILANNIYGVDLNSESVEITKLSLWLKTANRQEALTYLEDNIKVGNSLIDDPDIAGDLAFSWKEEFAETMSNGGFDVIIGNPPYIYSRNNNFTDEEQIYYRENYKFILHRLNTFFMFIDKGYELLKNNSGSLGYIVPNNWMTVDSFSDLRKFIINQTDELRIVNMKAGVFDSASVDTSIIVFKKRDYKNKITIEEFHSDIFNLIGDFSKDVFEAPSYIINIEALKNPKTANLLNKITENTIPLDKIADVKMGVIAYLVGDGKPTQTKEMRDNRVYHSYEKKGLDWLKYLEGVDVKRYYRGWSGQWIKYGSNLARRGQPELFNSPRILLRQIPSPLPYSINATYSNEEFINDINSTVILNCKIDIYFILGVMNSKLMTFWMANFFDKLQRKIFPQLKGKEIKQFPIVNVSDKDRRPLTDMVRNVLKEQKKLFSQSEKFLSLLQSELKIKKTNRKLENWFELKFSNFLKEIEKLIKPQKLSLPKKSEWMEHFEEEKFKALELKNKINQIDNKIDQMIYELYDLTSEEVNLVEQRK